MLPFLKNKSVQSGSVSVVNRKPDESKQKDEEDQGLVSCCQDIINAMESKDAKRLAIAFKDAFTICESYPHEEAHEFEMEEGS